MNGSRRTRVASEDRGDGGVAPPSPRREPQYERPEEELQTDRNAQREARDREAVAEAPCKGDEEAEEQRHVGGPYVTDHRDPEKRSTVDTPVSDIHDPQGNEEREQAENDDRDVGPAGREQRQWYGEIADERRPDEIGAVTQIGFRPGERVVAGQKFLRLRVDLVVEVDGKGAVAPGDPEQEDHREHGQDAEGEDREDSDHGSAVDHPGPRVSTNTSRSVAAQPMTGHLSLWREAALRQLTKTARPVAASGCGQGCSPPRRPAPHGRRRA